LGALGAVASLFLFPHVPGVDVGQLTILSAVNVLFFLISGLYETRETNMLLNKLIEERHHKTLFLGKMSHELRTPLVGIRGAWDVIQDYLPPSKDSSTIREVRKVVDTCFGNILQLIDDILDLSKISAGRLTLHYSPVKLWDVLAYSVNIVKSKAEEKNISISLEIDESVAQWVWADQQRLTQIMLNLLTNAVKFTQKGGVVVRASSKHVPEMGPSEHELHGYVTDDVHRR
jgi:signal transduction histidine kinase